MLRSTNNAEAEGSEVAREGCRPFSPLLWRYPTGSWIGALWGFIPLGRGSWNCWPLEE